MGRKIAKLKELNSIYLKSDGKSEILLILLNASSQHAD